MNKITKNTNMIIEWFTETEMDFEKEIGISNLEIRETLETLLRNYTREINYVMDTSITATDNFAEIFESLLSKSKIILTSTVIRELDMVQHHSDLSARNARYVLSCAAKDADSENFSCVQIPEKLELPDDNIIAYCNANKNEVILATADKVMALKARMFGIQTEYYPCRTNPDTEAEDDEDYSSEATEENESYSSEVAEDSVSETPQAEEEYVDNHKINSLFGAEVKNGKLCFDLSYFNNDTRIIRVWKEGSIEFSQSVVQFDIGDDVFISKIFEDNITFAHYQIIDNTVIANNCERKFSTRIYFNDPDSSAMRIIEKNNKYLAFVKDVLSRV